MKKIYFLVSAALLAIFTSCEDYNQKNFSDLDLEAKPTNLVTITYEMTAADFTTIANTIKKPVTDSLATNNASLTKAKADLAKIKADPLANKADTTALKIKIDALNTEITRLNGRLTSVPAYSNATKIDQNKFFDETLKAKDYIPVLLAQKFNIVDANSSIKVTYDMVNQNDTSAVSTTNKLTVTDADFLQMGSGTNQPGKTLNFTPAMNIMYYLNLYLKSKSPYAAVNETRMVRYKFNSSTTIQYRVLSFNGTDWKCANSQFALKKGKWQDVVILKALIDGIGDFKAISVKGDQVWAWDANYKYMMMTGFVKPAYFDNEDWLVSPALNFAERVNPWLNFTHVGRYFSPGEQSLEATRKAITVWISTKSDGNTINPDDWTKLEIPNAGFQFIPLKWTFIPSTGIDLSAYAGKSNVRIAFRYLSSAADNAAGTWEVKNVLVTEE
jgi:hypothetical protein